MVQVAACLLSHLSSCKLHSQPNSATGLSCEVDDALVTISAAPSAQASRFPVQHWAQWPFHFIFPFFFSVPWDMSWALCWPPTVQPFSQKSFPCRAGTASRRKLSSKALVPNMILQRQHAPFFFFEGAKAEICGRQCCRMLPSFWMVQQPSGGSFSLLFLIFFLGMIIIDKWNIPCHGDGWEAYVPRSLILITKSSKRYLHSTAAHNPQVSFQKIEKKKAHVG